MRENPVQQLNSLGQSVWYDNIQRRLLENGELNKMISRGEILGITSNPSIFQNAIANSTDYDSSIIPMAWAGWKSEDIFFQLAVEDIKNAASLFLPLYEKSNKKDGYVSLEVSPLLAHKTKATIEQAKKLWEMVGFPNLMIKIPATREGILAVKEVIAAGINVNVTLIFSIQRYSEVIDAYFSGLEKRLKSGDSIDSINSVASFFVSRLDTKIDSRLENILKRDPSNKKTIEFLLGKAAISNAYSAYQLFDENLSSQRFSNLKRHGGQIQRPLWASTSSKNPAYRDVIYVEELIAPHTVNTIPPKTLQAFLDHGVVRPSLEEKGKDTKHVFDKLESLGISITEVTKELENEGVKSFSNSFKDLLKVIDKRSISAKSGLKNINFSIGEKIKELSNQNLVNRIHAGDPFVWTNDTSQHEEIRNRLNWLKAPETSVSLIPQLMDLSKEMKKDNYTHVLLLGMGGSSLAPEVLANIFNMLKGTNDSGLILNILDSTDPDQVRKVARISPPEKTLYIISSKSGSTSEVSALFEYFWFFASKRLKKNTHNHFLAITDPGSSLENLARERQFKYIFLADSNVGGRYSALTAFGLIPAALIGIDITKFLIKANLMAMQCDPGIPPGRNPGLILGTIIGQAARSGQNKLTFISDPEFDSFGSWLEQLIAESSGKQGKGIVPIDLEPFIDASRYAKDRMFVYLKKSGKFNRVCKLLQKQGHPVLTMDIENIYAIGAEFYRWEFAIAVACSILEVNAFNQPDVQDNKLRTIEKITYFTREGHLEDGEPICILPEARVYGKPNPEISKSTDLKSVLSNFLKSTKENDYIAINAFLPRNKQTLSKLQKLRSFILDRTGNATTLGFGPRFLHSTGQLHKGGIENGVFLELTTTPSRDIDIPNQGLTFGTLEKAQALGDLEALLARNKRAIRIHLDQKDILKLISDKE